MRGRAERLCSIGLNSNSVVLGFVAIMSLILTVDPKLRLLELSKALSVEL